MNFLQDNPEPGQQYVYAITQSIDSVDGFYKELAKQVIDSPAFRTLSRVTDTLKKVAGGLLQRINVKVSVPFLDVSLDKGEPVNFQTDFEKLLEEIDLGGGKLIILVDEFTETLDNILIKHGKQGRDVSVDSSSLLHGNYRCFVPLLWQSRQSPA